MNSEEKNKSKQSLFRKLIGLGIMTAVAIYCIPELQERIETKANTLKNKWRKIK